LCNALDFQWSASLQQFPQTLSSDCAQIISQADAEHASKAVQVLR
jgi:hypothetical protein